ncbi:hypothetical protein [Novosphingobium percolationis]|uniref:hypothetical protein n=1 Tax=Novosphingobium percolationis TaxID=2871811 RepID=UPI001CD63FF3|nr:hypothetical protein [Novosphingobium percolationis]
MTAGWGMALAALAAGSMVVAPATAKPVLTHEATITHAAGGLRTTWSGVPRVTARQVGSPGAAGRPDSLRCLWRVDLDIARHTEAANGTSLHAKARAERAFELSRPGWCGREGAAFAGQLAARDKALLARLREYAATDTSAVMAQADALVQAKRPTG